MSNILVYSEESIISDSLIKVVNTCCGLNLNRAFVVKQSEDFFFEADGIFGKYLLLPNNREVRFVVARRKTQGTFIDAFIYEYQGEYKGNVHLNQSPKYAIEITKNELKDSGNMTDQRAAKFLEFKSLNPASECIYFVDIKTPAPKELSGNHERAFRKMATCGVQVAFSDSKTHMKQYSFSPYSSVSDFIAQGQSSRSKTNTITKQGKVIKIKTNLKKKNGINHDPNMGWLSSTLWTLFELGERDIVLTDCNLNHHLATKQFEGDNKLAKNIKILCSKGLRFYESTLGKYIQPGTLSNQYVITNETRGEKVGTIFLEMELLKKGWQSVFSNHAGCEKTDIKLGSLSAKYPLKTYGIPDLVMLSPNKKKVLWIEGEKSSNYSSGLRQIQEDRFLEGAQWFREQFDLDSNTQIQIYLSTYGKNHNNKQYLLAHTDKKGYTSINHNATPYKTA